MHNTRDDSQGMISEVEFVKNVVSFAKAGVSFFGARLPEQINSAVGLGRDVKIDGNKFEKVDKSAWQYSDIPGSEPIVGRNISE